MLSSVRVCGKFALPPGSMKLLTLGYVNPSMNELIPLSISPDNRSNAKNTLGFVVTLISKHAGHYDFSSASLLLHRNSQRLHLAVQMAALQPQDFRRARDIAMVLIQLLQDVIALIGGACLVQRGESCCGSSAFAMDQRRQVLALDLVRARVHDHQPLNHVAQLAHVSRP